MPPTPARPWWNCSGEGAVMEVPEEGVCVRMYRLLGGRGV